MIALKDNLGSEFVERVRAFFSEKGPLSKAKNFEFRPEQQEMAARIAQALETNSRVQTERELYIRADKNARYGIVAEVVAASRLAGVQSLNLLVEPEIEEVAEPSPAAAPKSGAATPQKK